jgi:hypothetical protein
MENHHFEDVNHRTKWAMASSSLTTYRAEDWQDWLKMEKPATARVHPGRPGQELSLALEGSMETHRVRSLRSHFVSSSSKNVQHIFRTDLFQALHIFPVLFNQFPVPTLWESYLWQGIFGIFD